MKLERACEAYGLRPSTEIQDFATLEELAMADTPDAQRITGIIAQLNELVFGAPLVVLERILGTNDGMTLGGLDRHSTTYEWGVTDGKRRSMRWTCGLIEAAYRRYAIGVTERNVLRCSASASERLHKWIATWA